MAKIKGNNVRVSIGTDLMLCTKELTFNFNTDTEEVTDACSGNTGYTGCYGSAKVGRPLRPGQKGRGKDRYRGKHIACP